MSQYNGRKKRSFFTKRSHGGNGTPKFMSQAMKSAIDHLRNMSAEDIRKELGITQ